MDLKKQPEWSWFKGRTVIVTGAANGLGRGMARQWAEHG
jgi:NAD(P)-dependent dehydrogenase (short-subunit alcohol dehydrogenase family)